MLFRGSLRRQLIFSISIVHALLMLFFVYDQVKRQKTFVQYETVQLANWLAKNLATNSESWLLAHDYSGLQEIVLSQKSYANLDLAMIVDLDGKILAHTDPSKIGHFITNEVLQDNSSKNKELITIPGEDVINTIATIKIDNVVMGKVWIILNQEANLSVLRKIAWDGILYTFLAILVGGAMAILVANTMTKRLRHLLEVADAIKNGEHHLRSQVTGPDEVGKLSAGFNLMLDSLELKEKSLKKAELTANMANKAKSDFLAMMSHEIRTPLNAIIGIADVLADSPMNEEQRKYFEIFQRSGENLINLVNDILDFSKLEAKELKIVKNSFSLSEFFDELKALNNENARHKKLNLEVNIDSVLPLNVVGDSHRLRQIMQNLVSNAIKFTETGFVTLTATLISIDTQDVIIEFSVIDSGIGIGKEEQEKLFQRFYQVETVTAKRLGGTGLGLAISKRLVELMGGHIYCESELGKGSRFYFTLSLQIDHEDARFVEKIAPCHTSYLTKTKKILLADDNEVNRILIRAFLQDQQVEITECGNGQEALELFDKNVYDLVLLDMQMPILDGYQTAKKMREWESNHQRTRTSIFALSGDSTADRVQKSLDAGCDNHLSKPIRKNLLIEALSLRESKL
jgi:hypothetical protein